MYSLKRRGTPGSLMLELKLPMNKTRRCLVQNRIKGVITFRSDPHLTNPVTYERKSLRNILVLKRNKESKFIEM